MHLAAVVLKARFSTVSRYILIAIFWIYTVVSLVDPFDQMFHSKSILFLTIFAVWLFRLVNGFTYRCGVQLWAAVAVFGAVIPLAATLIGLLGQRQPIIGMRFNVLEMFLMLFLILPVESDRIDLSLMLIRSCIVVAFIEIGIAVVSLISPLIYAGIYQFTAAKQSAYLSIETHRLGLGIGSFYYKTSATMILPLGHYLAKLAFQNSGRIKSGSLSLVYFVALVVSGARANVLGAVGIILAIAILWIRRKWSSRAAVFALSLCCIAGALVVGPSILDPNERSNSVKLGHIASYQSEFDRHPGYLLWGEGADTEFYTVGFGQTVTNTEVTYMELIRNFGAVITTLFAVALIWPLIMLLKAPHSDSHRYLIIPYAIYILISGSNPLLLNTTGLLLVVAVWGRALDVGRRCVSMQSVVVDC